MVFCSKYVPSKEISDFQFQMRYIDFISWISLESPFRRIYTKFGMRVRLYGLCCSLYDWLIASEWGWDLFPFASRISWLHCAMANGKYMLWTPSIRIEHITKQNHYIVLTHISRNEFEDYVNSHEKFHFVSNQTRNPRQTTIVNYRRQLKIHQKNGLFNKIQNYSVILNSEYRHDVESDCEIFFIELVAPPTYNVQSTFDAMREEKYFRSSFRFIEIQRKIFTRVRPLKLVRRREIYL